MKRLDTYYRALIEYKKLASSNAECETFLHALADAESANESIELKRTVCTVDTDWIEAIEQGLVHITSAICEERQFILSEGEVLPVEKVKSVSPESVKHLAKHSNLISRPPYDGTIIPDSIYTIERLNDYTVYENRFLYMLLCYLRDFISVRLEKIMEFSHKYEGSLILEKTIQLGSRHISYRIDLTEENKNDSYLRDNNTNKETVERISLILKTVLSLLKTPLMEDVAKVSMLKPPITKTNVLKMDKHFRGAVELYDYIMAYNKLGYTAQEEIRTISPFDNDLSLDIAGICSALSFVTYANALNLKSELANRLQLQEEQQKAEKIHHYGEQLAQIKRKMQNGEIEPEEYIHALEKRFRALEFAFEGIDTITEKLGLAEKEILSLRAQNTALDAQNTKLDSAIEAMVKRHVEETEALKSEHQQELTDVTKKHLHGINALESSNQKKQLHMRQVLKQIVRENLILKQEREQLLEEKLISSAKIKALLSLNGETVDGFTDKESFDRLEEEYEAFTRFYKLQWRKTKKEIRKKLLSLDALKGQEGDGNE